MVPLGIGFLRALALCYLDLVQRLLFTKELLRNGKGAGLDSQD